MGAAARGMSRRVKTPNSEDTWSCCSGRWNMVLLETRRHCSSRFRTQRWAVFRRINFGTELQLFAPVARTGFIGLLDVGLGLGLRCG